MKIGDGMHAIALLAALGMLASGTAVSQPRQLQELRVRHPPPAETADAAIFLTRLVGRFRYEGILNAFPGGETEDGKFLVSVSGLGDCTSIGESAGVHCILNLHWHEVIGDEAQVMTRPNLMPAMVLYGLEFGRPGIRYLQVDNKGIAQGGRGTIAGDRATFRAPCVNMTAPAPGLSGASGTGGTSLTTGSTSFTGGMDGAAPGMPPVAAAPTSGSSIASGTVFPSQCQLVTRIWARPASDIIYVWIDKIASLELGGPLESFMLTLRRMPQPAAEETR